MIHEDLSRERELRGSSDRSFGLVFFLALLAGGLWPLRGGGPVRAWALAAAALFLAAALARPSLLAPLNRAWTRIGLLIGRVTGPVAAAALFFAAYVPAGLLMRLLGRDALRLRRDPAAPTYWIPREPPGPPAASMTRQF